MQDLKRTLSSPYYKNERLHKKIMADSTSIVTTLKLIDSIYKTENIIITKELFNLMNDKLQYKHCKSWHIIKALNIYGFITRINNRAYGYNGIIELKEVVDILEQNLITFNEMNPRILRYKSHNIDIKKFSTFLRVLKKVLANYSVQFYRDNIKIKFKDLVVKTDCAIKELRIYMKLAERLNIIKIKHTYDNNDYILEYLTFDHLMLNTHGLLSYYKNNAEDVDNKELGINHNILLLNHNCTLNPLKKTTSLYPSTEHEYIMIKTNNPIYILVMNTHILKTIDATLTATAISNITSINEEQIKLLISKKLPYSIRLCKDNLYNTMYINTKDLYNFIQQYKI